MLLTLFIMTLIGNTFCIHHKYQTKYIVELITPGSKTPSYPDIAKSFINRYGIDQLTPNGERQHFTLGQQLKADYADIFKGLARTQDYEVYSVGTQSAQATLMSMTLDILLGLISKIISKLRPLLFLLGLNQFQ